MATSAFHTVKDYKGEHKTDIQEYQVATVRCYKCYSTDVTSVCHHCGRFMCQSHEAHPKFYQDPSREFVPLLSPPFDKGAHCEDHAHHTLSPLKVMALPGAVATVIGGLWTVSRIAVMVDTAKLFIRLAQQASFSEALQHMLGQIAESSFILAISFITLGLGVVLLVAGISTFLRVRTESEKIELEAVPLIAKQHIVKIEETIRLKMRVQEDEEPYLDVLSREGAISTYISLDEAALETLEAYRAKCERYDWIPKESFDVGYLAIQRPPGITWQEGDHVLGVSGNQVHFVAEGINIEELVESGAWCKSMSMDYEIGSGALSFGDDISPQRFAFWLRPVVEPMSGGRTLRFEFDLTEPIAQNATLKSFVLQVDRSAFPDGEATLPIIRTNGRLYPEKSETRWLDWPVQPDGGSRVPAVTFKRPVSEMGRPLTATFEIHLGSTISGLDIQQSHIWLPTGSSLVEHEGTALIKRSTQLIGEAVIDPAVFSYQYEFTVSALPLECEGITLTNEVIEAVVEALEKDQVYTKRVVEDIPVVELRDGAVRKCNYDILGRFYARIYPVDVHVILTGQEPFGEGNAHLSGVSAEVSLRALVNSQARDMEGIVKGRCNDLRETLDGVLQQMAAP